MPNVKSVWKVPDGSEVRTAGSPVSSLSLHGILESFPKVALPSQAMQVGPAVFTGLDRDELVTETHIISVPIKKGGEDVLCSTLAYFGFPSRL